MRETEIQVKEEEVEHVYCDVCGDRCTDNWMYEPKEVCKSCSSSNAVSRAAARVSGEIPFDAEPDNAGSPYQELLFMTLVWPFTYLVALDCGMYVGYSRRDKLRYTAATIGTAIWTTLVVSVIFLLL